MGLRTFTIPKASIALPGDDSFVVRGVSLNDIAQLVDMFRPDIESMFERFQATDDLNLEDGANVAYSMVTAAPKLVAYLIALASDEADAPDKLQETASDVLHLNAGTQIEALEQIGRLTFQEQSPKKLVEAVLRMFEGGRTMLDEFSGQNVATPTDSTTGSTG